jgi:hypothetical protein
MQKKRLTEGEPPPTAPEVWRLVFYGVVIFGALLRLPGYESFGILKLLEIVLLIASIGFVGRWFLEDHRYRRFIQAEERANAPERPPSA